MGKITGTRVDVAYRDEPLVLRESEHFEAATAGARIELNKRLYALAQAEDVLEKLAVLKDISLDMIQHNNPRWRELVTEFRSEELYGTGTPTWAESAAPGPDGEYTHIRRG